MISKPRLGLAAVFQNEGKGTSKMILSPTNCWDSNPVAIANLDNDGRMDLVIGGSQVKDSGKTSPSTAIRRNLLVTS